MAVRYVHDWLLYEQTNQLLQKLLANCDRAPIMRPHRRRGRHAL